MSEGQPNSTSNATGNLTAASGNIAADESLEQARQRLDQFVDDEFTMSWRPPSYYGHLLRKIKGGVKDILDSNPTSLGDVESIITEGRLDNAPISAIYGLYSDTDAHDKIIALLKMYKCDPEAAKLIVTSGVAGFHGSHSGSLMSVLEHGGLLSAAEARQRQVVIASGERIYSPEDGNRVISFADWRCPKTINLYARASRPMTREDLFGLFMSHAVLASEERQRSERKYGKDAPLDRNATAAAVHYRDMRRQLDMVTANPDSQEAKLLLENFPIAYGIDPRQYETLRSPYDLKTEEPTGKLIETAVSDMDGEFLIDAPQVSLDRIPVVAVPADKIRMVQDLFDQRGYKVTVIDLSVITGRDDKGEEV